MLSITIPLHNEEDSVAPLVRAVLEVMEEWNEGWELILVDDGSRDKTLEVSQSLAKDDLRIRVIPLARNYGQSIAMQAGFDHARGDVIITMDGDLQNDPRDIPRLLHKLREGHDLVTGYREHRQDKLLTRKVPSWLANWIIRQLSGVAIRDNGCSLKAYRREVVDRIRLYSDMHRFIPALAASLAGASIAEIPVRHHARRFGRSKYGLTRIAKVLADLLTLVIIRFFRECPLVPFSLVGIGFMAAAAIPILVALAAGLDLMESASLVVLSGITLCFVGSATFVFMLGLIAESVVREQDESDPLNTLIVHNRG